MGSCYSKIDREEMVTRCKARKRYTKQFVKARHSLAVSHAIYLRSLRSTGAALLQFANAEATRHHAPPPPAVPTPRPSPPPPPPPPMSSHSSDTWTTSSFTTSPAPPPPPPPPPPQSSEWDFWYPFVPQSRTATDEEWEATTAPSEVAATAAAAAPPSCPVAPPSSGDDSGFSKGCGSSSELALVVSRNSVKDLVGIIRDLDEYFLRAADSGKELSLLLEVPSPGFPSQTKGGRVYDNGCNLNPSIWNLGCSSQRFSNIVQFTDQKIMGRNLHSHCSTVERLFAWEKKLYQEVKTAGLIKMEHEKRVEQLRKLELKRADYVRTEKMKKEVEKLESQMTVASKAIESTSAEITQLRETELYPQLLEIVKGLMSMWRSMYECHQVQTHIVQQLKYLNTIPSMEPTTEIHRQATLQLEHEVQQWLLSFCSLVASQRDYMHSLTGWLRLSLFQFNHNSPSSPPHDSRIYSLCEDWSQAIDRIPDRVASEGIKSLLTVVHAIMVQQEEEHKQQKKSESVFKALEKRNNELRCLESKYTMLEASSSERTQSGVFEKRAKVAALRAKAEEEKSKQDKAVSVTRTTTLNNLQMGLPHVFQSVLGFSSVCMNAFESVYNRAKDMESSGVNRLIH